MPAEAKTLHEIRDAIHTFVRLETSERTVVNSPPYQRLRSIHQLAMTYLVYPGASHSRFEHCLGVMELASRIFDVVTDQRNLHNDIRSCVFTPGTHDHTYWRRVLRMAALCHDLGHFPFSHAAEDILPTNYKHEDMSLDIIRSPEMSQIWQNLKISAEDVGKLAVGSKHYPRPLSDWETLLSEIIIGDAFGADRMDYLLRDSLHAGVSYGRFEHHRLIDTMRILPQDENGQVFPTLGIEQGGLQSAESLLWARYFMYTQLYFHPVRRVYDFHLKQFLKEWLPNGKFSIDLGDHLMLTDTEVISAMRLAAKDKSAPGYVPARRIMRREHFKIVADITDADREIDPDAAERLSAELKRQFGEDAVFTDLYTQKGKGIRFPVLTRDGGIEWSTVLSSTLKHVPTFTVEYIFVDPLYSERGKQYVTKFRKGLHGQQGEQQ
jgi:HD superfamily phosphohydrolase